MPRAAPAGAGQLAVPPLAALAAAAPTLVVLALLFVALWFNGAYQLKSWGLLAVFALLSVAFGRRNGVGRWGAAFASGYAALAGWSLLSLLWSEAPGAGLEDSARDLLYAGLVALPLLTLPSRSAAVRVAQAQCVLAGAVVAVTVLVSLLDGPAHFLAGRLNDPVGYRNGAAALFALCFWPLLCAAAPRRAHPLLRAGAFALAVAALGLALLTQSRGVLIGFTAGAAVALALGPDRLRRAWLALLAMALVAVVSGRLLAPYDAFVATSSTSPAAISRAIGALVGIASVAFAVALLLALFDGGLRVAGTGQRRLRTAAAVALALLSVAGVAGALAVVGNPVSLARDKAHEFKQLEVAAPGETRLGSTGGQRYDLWRIALHDFEADPMIGAGEGAYPVRYYRERATDRNLTTPHSLPLRVLGELGLVGAVLLGGALLAGAVALARGWRSASTAERRWASALAAAAAVALGQSSVDWLWLIPGVAGLALLCLATAVAIVAIPREPAAAASPRRWAIATRAPYALAALLVGAVFVSDVYVRSARAAGDPGSRLDAARTAERLDPLSLPPRYLQAGALEELGRRPAARRELLDALHAEPPNFVTLGLLGDLETRAGHAGAARRYYRRALAMNPLDTGLQKLAR